ncbi:hypothetical protein ACFLZN_00185 [Nanoarchaeota archaeon]
MVKKSKLRKMLKVDELESLRDYFNELKKGGKVTKRGLDPILDYFETKKMTIEGTPAANHLRTIRDQTRIYDAIMAGIPDYISKQKWALAATDIGGAIIVGDKIALAVENLALIADKEL